MNHGTIRFDTIQTVHLSYGDNRESGNEDRQINEAKSKQSKPHNSFIVITPVTQPIMDISNYELPSWFDC